MGNSTIRYADEIIDICHEMKVLLSANGTFDSYMLKLLGRLQRLSLIIGLDEREDASLGDILAAQRAEKNKANIPTDLTEEERKQGWYCRKINGNNVVFSAETGEMIGGQPKAMGEENSSTVDIGKAVNDYAQRREKIGKSTRGKNVTNFEVEGTEMQVAVPLMIKDGHDGKDGSLVFELQRGKISHLQTIAASDMRRTVDNAESIASQYGGNADDWVKMKGIGTVKDENGRKRLANIHFFYNPEIGQGDWKVKQWVDEMTDAEKWWV